MLLIKILQQRSTFAWALSNLIALLRWNLFTYRDLWEWINRPFDTPPSSRKLRLKSECSSVTSKGRGKFSRAVGMNCTITSRPFPVERGSGAC